MTVWVVYRDYDYEGYGAPQGVFSTYELAKAYVEKNRYHKYEVWEIDAIVVDEE